MARRILINMTGWLTLAQYCVQVDLKPGTRSTGGSLINSVNKANSLLELHSSERCSRSHELGRFRWAFNNLCNINCNPLDWPSIWNAFPHTRSRSISPSAERTLKSAAANCEISLNLEFEDDNFESHIFLLQIYFFKFVCSLTWSNVQFPAAA